MQVAKRPVNWLVTVVQLCWFVESFHIAYPYCRIFFERGSVLFGLFVLIVIIISNMFALYALSFAWATNRFDMFIYQNPAGKITHVGVGEDEFKIGPDQELVIRRQVDGIVESYVATRDNVKPST
jgi:hypothetical protein